MAEALSASGPGWIEIKERICQEPAQQDVVNATARSQEAVLVAAEAPSRRPLGCQIEKRISRAGVERQQGLARTARGEPGDVADPTQIL